MTRLAPFVDPVHCHGGAGGRAGAARAHERGCLINATGCMDRHAAQWFAGLADRIAPVRGHPEALAMPPAPALPARPGWSLASATNTACRPWGVSYTANLPARPDTGLGRWGA